MEHTRKLERVLDDGDAYNVLRGREVVMTQAKASAVRDMLSDLTPPIAVSVWKPINATNDERGMVIVVRLTPLALDAR